MDFRINKLNHILALLVLIGALVLLVIYPLIQFLLTITQVIPSEEAPQSIFSDNSLYKLFVEVFMLIFQIIFVFFVILLGVPLLWYHIVNKYSLRDIITRLKLEREKIRSGLLWGFFGFIIVFTIVFLINMVLMYLDVSDNLSNISELERFFSPVSLYVLVIVQPIGEEIFFRGFLIDKISFISGEKPAVISTAILFGLSHLSYLESYHIAFYTMIMAVVFGVIFGLLVIKTRNLYTSIIAHVLLNTVSLSVYLIDKSYSF